MRTRLNLFALLLTLPVLMIAILGCSRGPCIAIVAPDGKTRATVMVEVADDEAQREVGLMYGKHLDDKAEMILVF